jgi:anti-sigma regulatory factor (Ser/Thr protein kinase)
VTADPQPWTLNLRSTAPAAQERLRPWLAGLVPDLGTPHLQDILLVATELVCNAYDHGRGALEVRMRRATVPCRIRVEFDDSRAAVHPWVKPPTGGRRGRGMVLVERLVSRWGVQDQRAAGTKTVWAEVACDGVDAIACAPRRPAFEDRR